MDDSGNTSAKPKPSPEVETLIDETRRVRVYRRPERLSPRILASIFLLLVALAALAWIVFQSFQ
jgi:hypothetical protein